MDNKKRLVGEQVFFWSYAKLDNRHKWDKSSLFY